MGWGAGECSWRKCPLKWIVRAFRCESRMRGKGTLGEEQVWAKAWTWENTTGKIKGQRKGLWVRQWGLVAWRTHAPPATATLVSLRRGGGHRKPQEHCCHQVNSVSWLAVAVVLCGSEEPWDQGRAGVGRALVDQDHRSLSWDPDFTISMVFLLICQGHKGSCLCCKGAQWIFYLNLPLTEHSCVMCQVLCWGFHILITNLKSQYHYYPSLRNEETEAHKS